MSYRVKYLTEDGWNSGPEYATIEVASNEYDETTRYYKFVQLVQTETVINETVVREAQQ